MNVHLFIHQFLKDWLLGFDIPEKWANLIKTLILVFTLALVCYIINLITKKVIRRVVGHLVKRSKAKWDNVYFEKGVFTKFSHYIPAYSFPIAYLDYMRIPCFLRLKQNLKKE